MEHARCRVCQHSCVAAAAAGAQGAGLQQLGGRTRGRSRPGGGVNETRKVVSKCWVRSIAVSQLQQP
jgi:hypothetical protein